MMPIVPCRCRACGGDPHYHVDAWTVIPWAEFTRAMKELEADGGTSMEVIQSFTVRLADDDG